MRESVGTDDLVRPDRLARQHDFVAGRQDRDARPAADREPGHVHRGGKADIPRRHQPPGRNAGFTRFEVDPGEPHVPVPDAGLEHGHPVARSLGIFLDDDGVGPVGQRSAGEDAHRLARPDPAVESAAGLNLPDPAQNHRRCSPHPRHARHSRPSPTWWPGGWVTRAPISSAVTRPSASGSATSSGGSGEKAARMRLRASATGIMAVSRSPHSCRPPCGAGGFRRSPCRDRPPCTCRRRSAPRPRPRSAPPSRRRCAPSACRSR